MTKKFSSRPKPTHVAAYGAALSTLALAPQAHASSIVALHASPSAVTYNNGTTVNLLTSGNAKVFSFAEANDPIGKSLITSVYNTDSETTRQVFGGLIKLTSVSNSLTLNAFVLRSFLCRLEFHSVIWCMFWTRRQRNADLRI